jgi:hypothetical protein
LTPGQPPGSQANQLPDVVGPKGILRGVYRGDHFAQNAAVAFIFTPKIKKLKLDPAWKKVY